ncbi:MAG TPA: MauE/DoxX family redox-associated membrane protein [Opitutaceae bacterium]|nr:MauE/DoxX family redox-associated membrane protein [Opitutaceae bacterium]
MKIVAHAIRLVLAFLFTWAAITKISDPRAFQDAIASYHLLPWLPAAIVTVWMPWLELTLAVALWIPRLGRTAAGMLVALCSVFLVALLQAWFRGIDITCGCFGDSSVVSGMAYLPYVGRDLGLVSLAVVLWRLDAKAAPVETGAALDNP